MAADVAALCFNALHWAMAIFLIASGVTRIFGVLHILNFAHGGFFLPGAYLAFALADAFDADAERMERHLSV